MVPPSTLSLSWGPNPMSVRGIAQVRTLNLSHGLMVRFRFRVRFRVRVRVRVRGRVVPRCARLH